MILAQFYRGPFDGERLVLPTEEPWPRFVIPERHNLLIVEYFYLLADQMDENLWAYLFDEDFATIKGDEPPTGKV